VELSGKVVVVAVEWAGAEGLARRMAAGGATVVLVGPDGDAAGRLAAGLGPPGRPAVFVSDGSAESLDALAAFVSELFREP
jgi:NAD(P)-dependent dehydrogenase (short-subunit alcohol dehydrogenase family)